jgi:hypothetical protein
MMPIMVHESQRLRAIQGCARFGHAMVWGLPALAPMDARVSFRASTEPGM